MSCSSKRVLVTGATGLIGKELVRPLSELGFDIYAITIDANNPENGVHWLKGSVFDEKFIKEVVAAVKPTHLLNMAWATTGDYLTSDINYKFLTAGISLAQAFAENGGKRAVYAGTCFEYKFKDDPLCETDELAPEKFNYTFCKDALRRIVIRYFKLHGVSFGYGRIFYAYGMNEVRTRLTGMIVDGLLNGRVVHIKSGEAKKDYLYSKDIAGAFAKFLDSEVDGCVNICSGHAISLREYVLKFAHIVGKEHLVKFDSASNNDRSIILGDNRRLKDEVGYVLQWSMDQAIGEILEGEATK